MKRTIAVVTAAVCVLPLAGCAINRSITAVDTREIPLLCIKENRETFMGEFHAELRRQVQAKGIKTMDYTGAAPPQCRYRMEYTANWRWDLAMYLVYANLQVWDADRMMGQAAYDARLGGLNLNKFGPTASKLQGLIDELFPGTRGGGA